MVSGIRQEPWLSLARNIRKISTSLNRRIDELLDLARGEIGMLALKPQPVNPRQLIYQIAEEVSKLTSKQRKTLRLELPTSLPVIQADEVRLRQVRTC